MNRELENLLAVKRRTALPGVLLAAAECSPLSKTGGLADVAGALPKSLQALGFDARVITPYHRRIKEKYAGKTEHLCDFTVRLGWREQYVGLEKLTVGTLTVYLVDNEYYFGDRIYRGGREESEQYMFFQRAVMECIPRLDFQPEVLHCNDWHTALLPFLIKSQYADKAQGRLKTVLTIHNIAFQGWTDFDFVGDVLGVDSSWYRPDAIEHYGCVNFLKAGCVFADRVNTVSPSYADEIRTARFGERLENVLISRGGDVSGIINGLDTEAFDPKTDEAIAFNFCGDAEEYKRENKRALIRELGLGCDEDTPIIAMVTRMTGQKGFDLVAEAIDRIMETGAAFVLVGTGDARYESLMREAQRRFPGRLCAHLAYDEPMSHRVYAGADMLLMPSAFEPCGLSQMIAMRYGTLPIVHEVGGLKDTVTPYNRFTHEGNGFSFAGYSAGNMLSAVNYALETWRDADARRGLIKRAMETDFSFVPSALEYAKLFLTILDSAECRLSHDPFDDTCRRPLGAVRCGEQVHLVLKADGELTEAELIVDGKPLPMKRCDGGFEAELTAPDEDRVLWYSFRVFGGVYCGADGVGSSVRPFQLTVYDGDFETPEWAKGAVMYQIFPDRWLGGGKSVKKGAAYHRALGRNIQLHSRRTEAVKWQGGEDYYPDDFYGGTLEGIEKSLPELRAMGVDIIYLNPIFESDSNHRYNTADYRKIDPMLGDRVAFEHLCASAEREGIHLILDGVFSHTGDDSVYFNKFGRYDSLGAYQGENSPYHSWYDFRSFPDDYRCWWGFKSLPEVNELDGSWQDFIVSGENSVVKTWLRAGASGYRLDVADELPDEVLSLLRRSIKEEKEDALIIGEVWEDATTKVSYGEKRRYALGQALDSVMNYPLRWHLIDFALGKLDAFALRDFLISQKLNYPAPMYHCLMNLLSSHDTARIRSVLGSGGIDGSGLSREEQAKFALTKEENQRGRALQKLCAALQFALPGIPCLYYGDEEGMQGLRDPFCRGPYRKNAGELREYYASLAALRRGSRAMKTGDAAFCAPDGDTICVLRFDDSEASITAVNRGQEKKQLKLNVTDFSGVERAKLGVLPASAELTVPAESAVMVKIM